MKQRKNTTVTEPTSGWLYHPYSCDDVTADVYLAVGTRKARSNVSDIVSEIHRYDCKQPDQVHSRQRLAATTIATKLRTH